MIVLLSAAASGASEALTTYEQLRHFADSWGLLALTLFFVGVVLFTLRPGSRRTHQDAADIPFRHEDRPAAASDRPADADDGRS